MSFKRDNLDLISPIASTSPSLPSTTPPSSSLSSSKSSESMRVSPSKKKSSLFDHETFSKLEEAILKATQPLDIDTQDILNYEGQNYLWCNKQESNVGDSLEYEINKDKNPNLIVKQNQAKIEYEQEIVVRYLRPTTPPQPGDLIIKQKKNQVGQMHAPLIIRQQAPRPHTPKPLVFREAPPKLPQEIRTQIITIPGKKLPPQPRRVIIERMPPLPAKPQSIIIERWLPFKERKRKVIFIKEPDDPHSPESAKPPRNTIIQWEAPKVIHKKVFKDLGIVRVDPVEYAKKYKDSLLTFDGLPDFIKQILPPKGILLASQCVYSNDLPKLEGNLDALKLIDLDVHGLSEYKHLLKQQQQPHDVLY